MLYFQMGHRDRFAKHYTFLHELHAEALLFWSSIKCLNEVFMASFIGNLAGFYEKLAYLLSVTTLFSVNNHAVFCQRPNYFLSELTYKNKGSAALRGADYRDGALRTTVLNQSLSTPL